MSFGLDVKNKLFYEYSDEERRRLSDKVYRRKKGDLLDYFIEHWEDAASRNLTGVQFLQEAFSNLKIKLK